MLQVDLAHKLLDFFNEAKVVGSTGYPYSLLDFIKQYLEFGPRSHDVSSYCRKLENEFLLNHMGTTSGPNPYYVHHYYTNKAIYDKELSLYGSYDLLVEGFIAIRNRFQPLVLPLAVEKRNGDLSIGSSFVYNSNTLITARHCLEDLNKISILTADGNALPVNKVYFSQNERLDIAVVVLRDNYFGKYPQIAISPKQEWEGEGEMDSLNFIGEASITVFAPAKILDDVLTLGYPPISGFESIQIADKSSVNSILIRSSDGQVLAEQKKYFDGIEYLLINAKVKGGNSGGPVFDRLGRIVGMIVAIPTEFENQAEIDSLGYGLALPCKYFKDLLIGIKTGNGTTVEKKVNLFDNNSFNVR